MLSLVISVYITGGGEWTMPSRRRLSGRGTSVHTWRLLLAISVRAPTIPAAVLCISPTLDWTDLLGFLSHRVIISVVHIDRSSMASSANVSLFLLLLPLIVVEPQKPSSFQVSEPGEISVFDTPTLSITFDPDTDSWFGEVIDAVEMKAGFQQLTFQGGKKIFFLQGDNKFIQLVLLSPDGSISTKLLFRFSNLYLIGFANRDDHWFVMKGAEHLMPGATILPFGYKYSELLFGIKGETTKQKVANLALGRAPTLEAVSTLSTNDPSNLNPKAPSSLGLFAVTVAESLRFFPIRQKISSFFDLGTTGYLDEQKYDDCLNNWARLSMLLLCSYHGRRLGYSRGYRELTKIHIYDDKQAVNIVAIMLRPSGYDPEDPAASCDDK